FALDGHVGGQKDLSPSTRRRAIRRSPRLRSTRPVREASAGDIEVLALALYAEEAPALRERGHARRAAAGEGVEHQAALRHRQAHEPAHQIERLDGWMDVA